MVAAGSLFVPPANIRVRLRNVASSTFLTVAHQSDGSTFAAVPVSVTQNAALSTGIGGIVQAMLSNNWFTVLGNAGQCGFYDIMSNQDLTVVSLNIPFFATTLHQLQLTAVTDANRTGSFMLQPNADGTQFRIINTPTNQAIYMNPGKTPTVGLDAPGVTDDDQWFVFQYEDLVLEYLDYKLDQSALLNVQPMSLAHQTNANDSNVTQNMEVTLSDAVTEESTFTLSIGVTVSISNEIEVGVPAVASDKVTIGASVSTDFSWGVTKSTTRTVSQTVHVTAKPHSHVKCSMVGKQGSLNVPFDAVYKGKASGYEMRLPGVYKGVAVYDVEAHYVNIA